MEDDVIVERITKTFNLNKADRISRILKRNSASFSANRLVALNDISFTVSKGEMFGIIGTNGSGKTTLLRIIAGIYKPDSGAVHVNGHIAPLLHIGTGFHNELTAHENIILSGMLYGITKSEIKEKIDGIIEFAELREFSSMKLKYYSSGMRARLAFSTALEINPDILLVDEILSVGDIAFREKSSKAFLSFKQKGKTILYTTHNLDTLPKLCDRVLLIHHGKVITIGKPDEVIKKYREITKSNHSILEISLSTDNDYTRSSEKIPIIPNRKYIVTTEVAGIKGQPFSAYFGVSLRDNNGKFIGRRIRWLNDFSGNKIKYSLVFQAPDSCNSIIIIYRINKETPAKSSCKYVISPISEISISEVNSDIQESYELPSQHVLSDAKKENKHFG